MTLKELSQLYYLNHEIESDKKRLQSLRRNASSPSSPNLTGMPYNGSAGNRLERTCAGIVDLENKIKRNLNARRQERRRLERYIARISDGFMRQVFKYRFVAGLSWPAISRKVHENTGRHVAPEIIKKACYRHIDKG